MITTPHEWTIETAERYLQQFYVASAPWYIRHTKTQIAICNTSASPYGRDFVVCYIPGNDISCTMYWDADVIAAIPDILRLARFLCVAAKG